MLQDCLSNSKKGTFEEAQHAKSELRREEFHKDSIYRLFKNIILGNEVKKHQFDFPLEYNPNREGRRIGVPNFENTKVRKIVENFDKVLNSSMSPRNVRDKLS